MSGCFQAAFLLGWENSGTIAGAAPARWSPGLQRPRVAGSNLIFRRLQGLPAQLPVVCNIALGDLWRVSPPQFLLESGLQYLFRKALSGFAAEQVSFRDAQV